jgi:hypothetical protein
MMTVFISAVVGMFLGLLIRADQSIATVVAGQVPVKIEVLVWDDVSKDYIPCSKLVVRQEVVKLTTKLRRPARKGVPVTPDDDIYFLEILGVPTPVPQATWELF